MKKVLFLALAAVVGVSSCKKDDSTDEVITLSGTTWVLVSQKENGEEKANECDKQTTYTFTDKEAIFKQYYKNDDGQCEADTSGGVKYAYKQSGKTVILTFDTDKDEAVLEGNTLIFTDTEGSTTTVITYKKQ